MNSPKPKEEKSTLPKLGKKSFTGKVVSAKTLKTITVEVETQRKDATYKKFVKRCKKFLVHDEASVAKEGDTVSIVETRPISKRKFFILKEVVKSIATVEVTK
jgi:small subunit ribosomal protein S17